MRWNLSELRRRGGLVAAIAASLVLLLLTAGLASWRLFGPERFDDVRLGGDASDLPHDPDAPLALSESTRVYLVFSTGSKGLSRQEAQQLHINDLGGRGADGLTDTMMLLLVDPPTRRAAVLSIPRDTWLFDRGHRVNATYNLHGLQAFVDDVAKLAGLPIHHVVEVNFAGFAQLVDDIGGVALAVPRPLADVQSVLYVPSAGCWRFDGPAALSYVRSRHTLTQRNGSSWVVHASASDVGRMGRQQELLGAAWEQLRGPGLITKIPSLLSAARSGLTLDDGLSVRDLADLARTFADTGPSGIEAYTLPTTGKRISGAAAQVVVEDRAKPILKRLRAWPPGPEDGSAGAATDGTDATTAGTGAPTDGAPSPGPEDGPDGPEEPTTPADAPQEPSSPSPSPVPDPEIETLPAPQEDCTKITARELPIPHAPLYAIYQHRGGAGGLDTRGEAAEQPTEEPSEEPTETDPTEEPSPGDDPGEDDDPTPDSTPILPLPTLPGSTDGDDGDGDGDSTDADGGGTDGDGGGTDGSGSGGGDTGG